MVVTLKPPGAPDRDRRPRATSNLAESYRQLQRLRSLVKQAEQQPAREPRLFLMNETKRPFETMHRGTQLAAFLHSKRPRSRHRRNPR